MSGPLFCDRCQALLEVGDWPFCPHGRGAAVVVADAIPGGLVIENLGPEPVKVYSETERRKIMKERGLVDAVRHRPGSPLTSNWNTPSAQMLKDGADLVSAERRRTPSPADDPEAHVEVEITITERGSFRVEPEYE
jgi:hypothetical protein